MQIRIHRLGTALSLSFALTMGWTLSARALQISAPSPVVQPAPLVAAAELPDSPGAQASTPASSSSAQSSQQTGPQSGNPQQTKRILGIIPNFRAVSSDQLLPAQSPREKFTTAIQDSFDYSAFIFVAVQAGAAQASNSTPEFHQGAKGIRPLLLAHLCRHGRRKHSGRGRPAHRLPRRQPLLHA